MAAMAPAPAQIWTLNSSNAAIYNGGSVGIGTSSPQAKFHLLDPASVTGIIETTGGTNAWAKMLFKNGDGMWDIGTSRNFNGDVFYIDRSGNPSINFQLAPSGYLGLGVTPFAKLHLFDSISVSERIESGGTTNAWSRIEFVNGDGQWNVGTSRNYNGDQLYFARQGSPDIAFAVQPNGDAVVSQNLSARTLTIRGGADLAEPFAVDGDGLPSGSVVVIDDKHPGRLKGSTRAYDRRVAGVISGANGIRSGISLQQVVSQPDGRDVALSGRVYVRADATTSPIRAGDLLTTSNRPGYAMKVLDHARASGAIIGKAMSALDGGTGFVLALVTLQ